MIWSQLFQLPSLIQHRFLESLHLETWYEIDGFTDDPKMTPLLGLHSMESDLHEVV